MLVLGSPPERESGGAVSLVVEVGASDLPNTSSNILSELVLMGVVCCRFCTRRAPRFGREKFSVEAGSDCTFVKG